MPVNQFDDNEFGWAADFNALPSALGGDAIISGCSISKGTGDWDIDVTSGQIIQGNTEAAISSGTVTITDSSGLTSGQSRVTLIHADTGDALASTDGTAATNPTSPDIPAGEVLLGFVVVADTDSTAADSDIFDVPALLGNDNARYQDGGSHEIEIDTLPGANGTDGQFLRTDGSAMGFDSFATERGSFSFSGTTGQTDTGTQSIVFSNTYDPNTFIPSATVKLRDRNSDEAGAADGDEGILINSTLATDGSGDVTGMDIDWWSGEASGTRDVEWRIMGVVV